MNAQDYYQHARALGAFPAHECLALARLAVALDETASAKKIPLPAIVSSEVLHDDTNPLTLSFGIKVF
jgi:hypothetical protein